jgi:hypothetical protein
MTDTAPVDGTILYCVPGVMQTRDPAEVVPEAVATWLIQRLIEAPAGLRINPPAVEWLALRAVTAVPPVVTVEMSNGTSVRSPDFVFKGMLEALPWTVIAGVEGVPALLTPALISVSICARQLRGSDGEEQPAVNALLPITTRIVFAPDVPTPTSTFAGKLEIGAWAELRMPLRIEIPELLPDPLSAAVSDFNPKVTREPSAALTGPSPPPLISQWAVVVGLVGVLHGISVPLLL